MYMKVVVFSILGLVTVPCMGACIAKYYSGFDYDGRQCSSDDGSFTWGYVDVPGGLEDDWKLGPRGQRESYCIEYNCYLKNNKAFIAADADDGVLVWLDGKVVIDKWDSHDPRGCHSKDGCKAKTGRSMLKIIFYQDYGSAHLLLKGGNTADESTMTPYVASDFDSLSQTEEAALNLAKGSKLEQVTNECCNEYLDKGCTAKCKVTAKLVGRIGSVTEVWSSTFWQGRSSEFESYYYISKCTDLLYLGTSSSAWPNSVAPNGDNVILEVTMGDVVDYFKPIPGKNLCEMLMSNRMHLWSRSGKPGTFIQPMYYYHETLVGGSNNDWPKNNIIGDGRTYLSFWGGNGANGACCHASKWDVAKWNRAAFLRVMPYIPTPAPQLSSVLPAVTTPVTNWLSYAVLPGGWNTAKFNEWILNGIRDEYSGVNGGVYYLRSCKTWEAQKNSIVLAVCMNADITKAANCEGGQIDYYTPVGNATLCDMLGSFTKHRWAYATGNTLAEWKWVTPQYYNNHFGGSLRDWPARWCQQLCNQLYNNQADCEADKFDNGDNVCVWTAQNRCDIAKPTNTTRCTERRTHLPFWAGTGGGAYGVLDKNGATNDWNSPGRESWTRAVGLKIAKL